MSKAKWKRYLFISLSACIILSKPSEATLEITRMVIAEAQRQGVPLDLALGVSKVESGHRCGVIGRANERGPLQILPSTALSIGFPNITRGGCAYQIRAGMRHLAICLRGVRGNKWLAAACHNQGFSILAGKPPTRKASRYANLVMGHKHEQGNTSRLGAKKRKLKANVGN